MAAPIEYYNEMIASLKAAFVAKCPKVQLCQRRVEEVFSEVSMISDYGDEIDLYKLAMLAEELGLTFSLQLVEKKAAREEEK